MELGLLFVTCCPITFNRFKFNFRNPRVPHILPCANHHGVFQHNIRKRGHIHPCTLHLHSLRIYSSPEYLPRNLSRGQSRTEDLTPCVHARVRCVLFSLLCVLLLPRTPDDATVNALQLRQLHLYLLHRGVFQLGTRPVVQSSNL